MEQSEKAHTKITEPFIDEVPEKYIPDQEGIEVLMDLLGKVEDSSTADYNLGTLLLRQGQITEALQHFEAAVGARPDHFDALFNGGLCHLHREDKEQALFWFIRAAGLRPEDWQAQYVTGEILLQVGRADEALAYFRAAYAGNSTHFETLQGFAITLLNAKQFEAAAAICDETMVTHGAATLPLQLKGDAMLALGRYEEAVRCHIDLCRIDLDIRDFIVSRLQALRKEDEQAYAAYAEIVHQSYPEFEGFVKAAIPVGKKNCSGCVNNRQLKESKGGR